MSEENGTYGLPKREENVPCHEVGLLNIHERVLAVGFSGMNEYEKRN